MNDSDACVFCNRSCSEHGRHAIEYPARYRDRFVCDDCALGNGIVCQCCEAGPSIDEFLSAIDKEYPERHHNCKCATE